ncbi:hypothetical protein Poli38472_012518 [Pythium oligandrum]|uniref:Homologous-pairing protein 2 homolog n=1 Tax=Pythium oligandrum TaxID=41045 RepID=A0A8K1CDL4_PYTOL|nr:hypothetical protein Poli38472_012518 [Pythium oligandrum]|eukprot:TMW61327.1 hypothetical protein Poli38472_012518 [Pythium oligandrum]
MARDDDFEDDDFSLGDDSEEDNDADESFSEADAVDDAVEEEDDGGWSGEDEDESDFEGKGPKAKKAKTTAKPAAKKSPPARKTPAATKKATSAAPASRMSSTAKAPANSPKPKAPKKSATPEKPAATIKGDPTTHVLEYMRKMNRPYSMLNVFENLHRAIAKPALTKILDTLADKEELASKTYGKAKIYYMNQNRLPVPSEAERRDVEDQIKQVEADCITLEQELKTAEAALAGINSQMSDADLDKTLAELTEEAATLETKLATLERPDRVPVSPGRKDALKRKFTTYRTAWVARKRIVMDAVNQIADGMEKKPKAICELVGIETDAEAGIQEIPSI